MMAKTHAAGERSPPPLPQRPEAASTRYESRTRSCMRGVLVIMGPLLCWLAIKQVGDRLAFPLGAFWTFDTHGCRAMSGTVSFLPARSLHAAQ